MYCEGSIQLSKHTSINWDFYLIAAQLLVHAPSVNWYAICFLSQSVRVHFRRYWCDWPDTVENRRREEFCYFMESYFEEVCQCKYIIF